MWSLVNEKTTEELSVILLWSRLHLNFPFKLVILIRDDKRFVYLFSLLSYSRETNNSKLSKCKNPLVTIGPTFRVIPFQVSVLEFGMMYKLKMLCTRSDNGGRLIAWISSLGLDLDFEQMVVNCTFRLFISSFSWLAKNCRSENSILLKNAPSLVSSKISAAASDWISICNRYKEQVVEIFENNRSLIYSFAIPYLRICERNSTKCFFEFVVVQCRNMFQYCSISYYQCDWSFVCWSSRWIGYR